MLYAAGQLVRKLPEGPPVYGVTSIADEVFVLRNEYSDQVEVYDATSYRLVRRLTVPNARSYSDMTSCEHHRCLYIADPTVNCVHRLDAQSAAATHWPLTDRPAGLSVTSAQRNVIVTCRETRRIVELNAAAAGAVVREVALPDDVLSPIHAVQTGSGRFVVCHGVDDDPVQRVCTVSADGRRVVRSHGGKPGSGSGQYKVPRQLAVDQHEFVFVVDLNNWRVTLLSPTLGHLREVVSRDEFQWGPDRLRLDVQRRRLYVAENEWQDGGWTKGRVLVFSV